jgi:hypothetical protein
MPKLGLQFQDRAARLCCTVVSSRIPRPARSACCTGGMLPDNGSPADISHIGREVATTGWCYRTSPPIPDLLILCTSQRISPADILAFGLQKHEAHVRRRIFVVNPISHSTGRLSPRPKEGSLVDQS